MLHIRQLFNNIRRYTHTHSPSNKSPKSDNVVLESKLDKIMAKLDQIDFMVKCNYFITVFLPGIILFFK
jgi:hypothetical protein